MESGSNSDGTASVPGWLSNPPALKHNSETHDHCAGRADYGNET